MDNIRQKSTNHSQKSNYESGNEVNNAPSESEVKLKSYYPPV